METYNPILRYEPIVRRGMGSPRPRPAIGVAHVLYGRGTEPLVLDQGRRLTRGESMFGGYTEAYMVDMSKKRLERTAALPCRGDAHNFTATFALTCWVTDPAAVVRENIQDAGAVLWSAVLHHARAVSRQYTLGDTAVAEQAIAERLTDVLFHQAFATEPVAVHLAPDPQAVEIGRRTTDMTVWNSLIDIPLAAAYLADHPGDIPGALAVVREMLQQHDEAADIYRAAGGRIGPEMKETRRELLDRQQRLLHLPRPSDRSSEGVRPALPPRDMSASTDDEEDEEDDDLALARPPGPAIGPEDDPLDDPPPDPPHEAN